MLKHHAYYVFLGHFVKLTEWSLTMFKRDFKKSFQMPSERLLRHQQLAQAYYLIA
jgi:hypothetical protein